MTDIIDLKEGRRHWIQQYVDLRNTFVNNLNTRKVTLKETLAWLEEANVIIIGSVKNTELVGTALLYLDKNNEFTIFTKAPRKGIGTVLGKRMEEIALTAGIKQFCARVNQDNQPALHFFEKNGWERTETKDQMIYFVKKLLD